MFGKLLVCVAVSLLASQVCLAHPEGNKNIGPNQNATSTSKPQTECEVAILEVLQAVATAKEFADDLAKSVQTLVDDIHRCVGASFFDCLWKSGILGTLQRLRSLILTELPKLAALLGEKVRNVLPCLKSVHDIFEDVPRQQFLY